MSSDIDTETDASSDAEASEATGNEDAESERDDHQIQITLSLDNPAAAHVTALRDAGVPVEAVLAQGLEQPAERLLFNAHQQQKHQPQQGGP